MPPRSLQGWLEWQDSLHHKKIELGLERVGKVAQRLGLPTTSIFTVTVAGTNGKGSSATLTETIYRAAGYRTGLYTSPHLLRYNERISVNGSHASDDDICRAFTAIEAVRENVPLTYFEFGTLAALWLFREADVQIQVLEVGLGGRLDAVNLVDADVALITPIGLDHQDWLGPDRESIALEKAGILRAARPAVYQDPNLTGTIPSRARELGVPLRVLGRDFHVHIREHAWDWRSTDAAWCDLPFPALAGTHQIYNATGVLAAIQCGTARYPVSRAAIEWGLKHLQLPGRFQRIGLYILDVAHNAEAAQVLADNLAREQRSMPTDNRIHMLLALLADKPLETIARILQPHVGDICVAGLTGLRGMTAETQRARLAAIGMEVSMAPDVPSAIRLLQGGMKPGDRLLITGSFHTVAAAWSVL